MDRRQIPVAYTTAIAVVFVALGVLGFFVKEPGNGLPADAPIQQGRVVVGQTPVDAFNPDVALDPSQVSR